MSKKPKKVFKSLAEIELSAELEQKFIAYALEREDRFSSGPGEMAVILPKGDTPELRAARKALSHMEQYGIAIPPRGKR